ncbi:MAG TPA: hypothetical protein VJI75_05050 [Candidatus Nanoarchaeia archaeon]|nr:hypothetical protein [Candidatus Nanoarchaeia archaeon]
MRNKTKKINGMVKKEDDRRQIFVNSEENNLRPKVKKRRSI